MGGVERAIVEALIRFTEAGAEAVTEEQLLASIVSPEEPARREAPSYTFGVRLVRRGRLAPQWEDRRRVGYRPPRKAYT